MSDRGDNRLPALAAKIKEAHAGVLDAAKTAAERAIEAGRALIEARALLEHGQWLPWLKEHCALPERTAQLYMKIAKLGLESATVADIGLRAAAKVIGVIRDPSYRVFAHCNEAEEREWSLFILFLAMNGQPLVGAFDRVEWLSQRQFKDPKEWLGDEGARCRKQWGMREPSAVVKGNWQRFLDERSAWEFAAVKAEIDRMAGDDAEAPPCRHRGRRS